MITTKTKMKEPRIAVVYDYKHEGSNEDMVLGTVWLRVYYTRTSRKYISTGVRVLPCHWSDKFWVIGREDAAQLNRVIREQVKKAEKTISAALEEQDDMPGVKAMKVDRRDASFLDFMAAEIDKAKIKPDTRIHHLATYSMLMEWGRMRRFEDVTKQNILAFIDWIANREVMKPSLDGTMKPVKIKQCTVYDHWSRLRKYISIAQGENLIPVHVTKNLTISRGEPGRRVYLTDEEIDRWLNTRMESPALEMARLRFIVQMGCGMAYADFMSKDFSQCEKIDGAWVLTERRVKTGEDFFCVLLPFAVEVLQKWEWKIPPISNTNYNKFLIQVAAICGIQKRVTSHAARHTYAMFCLRHGVRIEAVQRTLGHQRLETTQIYAQLIDKDVLEAYKKAKIIV